MILPVLRIHSSPFFAIHGFHPRMGFERAMSGGHPATRGTELFIHHMEMITDSV